MKYGVLELAGKLNAGVKQLVADRYIGSYLEIPAHPAFDFFGSLSTTKTLSFWASFGLRPDLLYDKCTTLTGWTVADAGSGVTDQGTYVGRSDVFRQRVTSPAASNYATVKRLSVTKKCYTAEFDLYIATHGAFASTSYPIFELATLETGAHVNVIFASDGVFFYNGSTYSNIGSVSTGVWNRWRFEVVSSGSKLQIGIYKDNSLVTATSADWATGAEPGYIYLSNYGYTSATTCYWDNIKISSNQNEKPLSPVVGSATPETFAGQYDDVNNYWRLYFDAGSGFKVHFRSGGVDYSETVYANDVTDSDEHHVALITKNGVTGLYVDGDQIGYSTFAVTKTYSGSFTIGSISALLPAFNGTIRDIFIQDANTFSANPNVGITDTIIVPTANHVPTVDTVFCVNTDGYQDFSRYVDSSASGLTVRNRGVLTDNHAWTYGNGAARFSGGTQQKIVIPNLDGDKMSELSINMFLKNAYAGANNYYLQANCDVGSNYEYTYLYGSNTTAAGQYGGALTSFFVGGANAQNEYGINEITFETRRKGAMRSLLQKRGSAISGTTVTSIAAETQWWNTNTENLDVLVLKAQNNGFAPGSHLIMFESSTEDSGQPMGDVNVMGKVSAGVMQLIYHHEVVSAPDAVKLLLHFDGNDSDTIVTDSSPSKHAVTANGGFSISTVAGFVGYESSGYFDGIDSYLSIPDSAGFDFESEDGTLECNAIFAALPSSGQTVTFLHHRQDSNNEWSFGVRNNSGTYQIRLYVQASGVTTIDIARDVSLVVGTKYHISVIKSSTTFKAFLDGTQIGADLVDADPIPNITGDLNVGGIGGIGAYFNGWLGEVRITKGIAQYTADFTPPTRPHRGNRSNHVKIGRTQLAATQSHAAIVDECNHIILKNGNVYKTTDVKMVGNGSCFFDGSTGYLSLTNSTDFDFGSGDFTIATKFVSYGSNIPILYKLVDTNNRWDFEYVAGGFTFVVVDASITTLQFSTSTSLEIGKQYEVELTRNGSNWYLFLNGVSQPLTLNTGSYSATLPTLDADLIIGYYAPAGRFFSGYIDEFEVSKGIARHISGYTVTNQPKVVDAYTKLLLHFDFREMSLRHYPDQYTSLLIHGINGNDETDVLDSSVYNHTISCYGGARISAGKVVLDGVNDYLSMPDSEAWSLSNRDFTIKGKFTLDSNSASQVLIGQYVDVNNYWQLVFCSAPSDNKLAFLAYDGGVAKAVYVTTSGIAGFIAGTEYDIEFTRVGATAKIFVDGVSVTLTETTAFSTNTLSNLAVPLEIGRQNQVGNYSWFEGKVRQLQLSVGISRHTTDFVPSVGVDGEFTEAVGIDVLDGDKDVLYLVHGVIASESSGIASINMLINEDASSIYGLQRLSSIASAVSAQRYTAQPYIASASANNGQVSVLNRLIAGAGGILKLALGERGEQVPASSYATEFHINGEVYNSLLPVSAIELKGTFANSIGVGSEISVYALRKR